MYVFELRRAHPERLFCSVIRAPARSDRHTGTAATIRRSRV